MKEVPENTGRRKFLTATTAVVGGIGAIATAVPFIKSWNPSEKAKAAGAPIKVDISKIEPGQLLVVEWRGKPVWIVNRTQAVLDELNTHNKQLRDPNSEKPQQPQYAQNTYRAIKKEFFIAIGLCTHLGCSPTYIENDFSKYIKGIDFGFFCPCHGSKFDMSGRVFVNVPAPLNLEIPPYQYIDNNTIIIGIDEEGAA